MNNDYEKMRAQLWRDVCVAAAPSIAANEPLEHIVILADFIVDSFDTRFKPRMYDQMNCSPQIAKETNER